ncbi:MAG: hypothetical protein AMXMBFR84_34820 [Candidatus Hydrogenedentota bacterium]
MDFQVEHETNVTDFTNKQTIMDILTKSTFAQIGIECYNSVARTVGESVSEQLIFPEGRFCTGGQ